MMALLNDLDEIRWVDPMTASAIEVCRNGQAGAISDYLWSYLCMEVSIP